LPKKDILVAGFLLLHTFITLLAWSKNQSFIIWQPIKTINYFFLCSIFDHFSKSRHCQTCYQCLHESNLFQFSSALTIIVRQSSLDLLFRQRHHWPTCCEFLINQLVKSASEPWFRPSDLQASGMFLFSNLKCSVVCRQRLKGFKRYE
jgi:hypothetical protein